MCYGNPPRNLFSDIEENTNIGLMPCFKCPNAECTLSKGSAASEKPIFSCPKCSSNSIIARKGKNNAKFFLGCKGFPQCKNIINIPESIIDIQVLNDDCHRCGQGVKKCKLKFSNDSILPSTVNMRVIEEDGVFCFGGCDQDLEALGYTLMSTSGYSPGTPNGNSRSYTNNGENSNSNFSTQGGNSFGNTQEHQGNSNVRSFLEKYQSKQQQAQGQGTIQTTARGFTTPAPQNNNQTRPNQGAKPSPNTTDQSPSKLMCSSCKVFGHNLMTCPKKKAQQNLPGVNAPSPAGNIRPQNSANLTNITNTGVGNRGGNFSRPGLMMPSWDGTKNISNMEEAECMRCKGKGHYSNQCPGFPKPGTFGGGNNFTGKIKGKRNESE